MYQVDSTAAAALVAGRRANHTVAVLMSSCRSLNLLTVAFLCLNLVAAAVAIDWLHLCDLSAAAAIVS
jgi:hypothetical protein